MSTLLGDACQSLRGSQHKMIAGEISSCDPFVFIVDSILWSSKTRFLNSDHFRLFMFLFSGKWEAALCVLALRRRSFSALAVWIQLFSALILGVSWSLLSFLQYFPIFIPGFPVLALVTGSVSGREGGARRTEGWGEGERERGCFIA